MNILVIGGGGREHALCRTIARSSLCKQIYCAPGNAGISSEVQCIPIRAEESDRLVEFVKEYRIDFVVIGPEAPLVEGLVDRLEERGIATFGPSKTAARLEGSKRFMKELCYRYGIRSAKFQCFEDPALAKSYARTQGVPIVIKVDGLAGGKGVTVAKTLSDADVAIDQALVERRFGAAGRCLVLEEYLAGEEVSFFALVDGKNILPLPCVQDHKAVFEGDQGPNTGGMGAYSPAPLVNPTLQKHILDHIITPTVKAMETEGTPFRGVLYAGLMVMNTDNNLIPYVLEFNVRFGDPECQVLLVRLLSDLLPALIATREGVLDTLELRWSDKKSLGVVLAAQGYPDHPITGTEIQGLEDLKEDDTLFLFHAATQRVGTRLLAQGGRVLTVTALGDSLKEAQDRAYEAIEKIDWKEGFYRRDIGWRAL